MKIAYDKDADALYIELVAGQHYQCKRVAEDVVLDFMGEDLAGIEVHLYCPSCERKPDVRHGLSIYEDELVEQ